MGIQKLMHPNHKSHSLILVIPSFGDSKSALEIVEEVIAISRFPVIAYILDDSAGIDVFSDLPKNCYRIIPNRRLGQNNIIVQFLQNEIEKHLLPSTEYIIAVMDADGEDCPKDLINLCEILIENNLDSVIAQRGKRQSGLFFSIGYFSFRCLSKLITGYWIKSGNFSISRKKWLLNSVWTEPFTESFAAGLILSKGDKKNILCHRQPRRYGKSNMSKSGLVEHGLKILLSFAPVIATRTFVAAAIWGMFSFLLGSVILILKLNGHISPGWTTLAFSIFLQVFILLIIVLLTNLNAMRNSKSVQATTFTVYS
jgi:hypothetical protein